AASECVPFAKTGGLADVVGALGPELAKQGHEVTAYLPLYASMRRTLPDQLLLPWEIFTMDKVEQFDKFNFLKGGLVYADILTTVSRKYAEEIKTPEFGEGLDRVLRGRAVDLRGILNGVDYAEWN